MVESVRIFFLREVNHKAKLTLYTLPLVSIFSFSLFISRVNDKVNLFNNHEFLKLHLIKGDTEKGN